MQRQAGRPPARETWAPSRGRSRCVRMATPARQRGAAPSEPAGKGRAEGPSPAGDPPHGVSHCRPSGSLRPLWEQPPCTCAGWGAGHSSPLGEGSGCPGAGWEGPWASWEQVCGRGLGSAQTTQPRLGSWEVLRLQGTQSRGWARESHVPRPAHCPLLSPAPYAPALQAPAFPAPACQKIPPPPWTRGGS